MLYHEWDVGLPLLEFAAALVWFLVMVARGPYRSRDGKHANP